MRRTALITGANRGIGLQTAMALADRGLRVMIGARDPELGERALQDLPGEGHGVVALDTANPDSIWRALDQMDRDGLTIDVLVNNAAILVEGNALGTAMESIDESWQTNVRGPWLLCQGLIGGMLEREYGRVVNVSSGGGSFGEQTMMIGHASYTVTKAALNALTVCLAGIVTGHVKVNSACLGWVRTRMGGDDAPRSVEEAAPGVVWLATLPDDGPSGGFYRDCEPVPW